MKSISEDKQEKVFAQICKCAFDSNQDGIAIFNIEAELEFANNAFVKLSGYQSQAEIQGLNMNKFFPPEEASILVEAIRKCKRTETIKMNDARAQMKNGEILPVSVYAFVIYDDDDQKAGLTCSIRDITDRKRAEENLCQSDERYQALFDRSLDLVYISDFEGKFIDANPAALNLLGYKKEDILCLDFASLLSQDQMPEAIKSLEELKETGSQKELTEFKLKCKDGEYIDVESKASVIYQDGKPYAILGIARDITERKRAEKEKEKIFITLAQTEKLASLGRLAGGMAHEINNPLGYIHANLNVLNEYHESMLQAFRAYDDLVFKKINELDAKKLDQERKRLADLKQQLDLDYLFEDFQALIRETREGVDRVSKIVKSMGKLSDTPAYKAEWADINESMESTLNMVWNELKYKAEVKKEYGELPQIKCYPGELSQVFMNILTNAAQAIKARGKIHVRTWTGDGYVNVEIKDTGKGISEDHLKNIFDPFYTTKEVGKGTGLGLSISYGIVKKHGGEIKVESEPGKGSTFTISLPIET